MQPAWRGRTRRTLLYRYFAVILAVSAAVLIASTLISYRFVEDVVVQQVHAHSVEQLEQVRSVFDAVHFSVIPAAVQLSQDRLVSALMYSQELSSAQVLQAISRLDTAKLSNPLVDSITVYNHLTATFYSTNFGMVSRSEVADEALTRLVDNAREYGLYRYIPRRSGDHEVFTLLLGSPPVSGSALKGAMIFDIGERALRDLFASSAGRTADHLTIYDRSGLVLSHADAGRFASDESARPFLAPVLASDEERGAFIEMVDGEQSLVTFVRNEDFGWSFVTTRPYESIFGELVRARNAALAVLGGLLLVAVVGAFLASKRLYRPIGSMQEFARRLEGDLLPPATAADAPSRGGSNEIAYVEDVLHRVYLRTLRLNDTMLRHRRGSVREATRMMILSGEMNQAIEAVAATGPFRVVVAVLDNSADIHRRFEYHSVIAALTAYAEELSRRLGGPLPGVEMEPDHVAVLCSADLDSPEQARELLEPMTRHSVAGTAWTFSIGLGILVTSLEEAPDSYRSARDAAGERFRLGSACVVSAGEATATPPAPYRFPDDLGERLVRSIRTADDALAIQLLDTIFAGIKGYGYEDFLLSCHILLHRLQGCAEEGRPPGDRPVAGLARIRAGLAHFETIATAREWFADAVRELCEFRAMSAGRKREELVEAARRLIQEGLTDPNLGSKWLSDRLAVSTNYLRSVFRDVMGLSVSDYINEARIELCKTRLAEDAVQVKELYAELGFGSYNYFFTLFRKHTGLTPIQFKRSLKV